MMTYVLYSTVDVLLDVQRSSAITNNVVVAPTRLCSNGVPGKCIVLEFMSKGSGTWCSKEHDFRLISHNSTPIS